MKQISGCTKQEKIDEIISNINLLNNISFPTPNINSEIISFLEKSKFIDKVYFITNSPTFEIKNDNLCKTVRVGTYQVTNIDKFDDIVKQNPKKYIIFYNLHKLDKSYRLRCALIDGLASIRDAKIEELLNPL